MAPLIKKRAENDDRRGGLRPVLELRALQQHELATRPRLVFQILRTAQLANGPFHKEGQVRRPIVKGVKGPPFGYPLADRAPQGP